MYEKLIEVFKDWNSKINLSAIRDDEGIRIKHIQDSLEGNKILQQLFSPNEKKEISLDLSDKTNNGYFGNI